MDDFPDLRSKLLKLAVNLSTLLCSKLSLQFFIVTLQLSFSFFSLDLPDIPGETIPDYCDAKVTESKNNKPYKQLCDYVLHSVKRLE